MMTPIILNEKNDKNLLHKKKNKSKYIIGFA